MHDGKTCKIYWPVSTFLTAFLFLLTFDNEHIIALHFPSFPLFPTSQYIFMVHVSSLLHQYLSPPCPWLSMSISLSLFNQWIPIYGHVREWICSVSMPIVTGNSKFSIPEMTHWMVMITSIVLQWVHSLFCKRNVTQCSVHYISFLNLNILIRYHRKKNVKRWVNNEKESMFPKKSSFILVHFNEAIIKNMFLSSVNIFSHPFSLFLSSPFLLSSIPFHHPSCKPLFSLSWVKTSTGIELFSSSSSYFFAHFIPLLSFLFFFRFNGFRFPSDFKAFILSWDLSDSGKISSFQLSFLPRWIEIHKVLLLLSLSWVHFRGLLLHCILESTSSNPVREVQGKKWQFI